MDCLSNHLLKMQELLEYLALIKFGFILSKLDSHIQGKNLYQEGVMIFDKDIFMEK